LKELTVGSLLKFLVKEIPDFRLVGRLLYRPITKGMLVGCYFESSDFEKKTAMITCFATVAAYPLDSLSFDLPFRLRDSQGGDRWNIGSDKSASEIHRAITVQALPFLDKMQSPQAFAEELLKGSQSVQSQRGAAVALAYSGERARALAIVAGLFPKLDQSIQWQAELVAKLSELSERLENGTQRGLLADWERTTRERLKLV
jgi:hypothetical protein